MQFLIVSYYTIDTAYADEVAPFTQACLKCGIQPKIKGYKSLGSWYNNTSMKPNVILDFLLEYPDYNIVFIDIDGRVEQYPILFNNPNFDLGVHYLVRSNLAPELLSGTIFLRNIKKVHELVRLWIEEQKKSKLFDQKVLQETVEKYAKSLNIKVENIPPQYTQIFDIMAKYGKPVILHTQASRRYRRGIGP